MTRSTISSEAFDRALAEHGMSALLRAAPTTVQINLGKLCNQACHHCHVDAGPKRPEQMTAATADEIARLLSRSTAVETVDVTGGAPELNRCFRDLVGNARGLGLHVIDRCNLTVLFEPGMQWLPSFLVDNEVELVCSLPCYTEENVDKQRGVGVFDKSIEALRLLGGLGYGHRDSGLELNLVYNPVGATLPPDQEQLQVRYKQELRERFAIEFNRLFTITNMPIKRFADQLHRWDALEEYMGLLVNHFNPTTLDALMCRSMVSVGWEGSLYDCDFNQMLDISLTRDERPLTLSDLASFDELAQLRIATAAHCFGCTAGNGSSCGGALEAPHSAA